MNLLMISAVLLLLAAGVTIFYRFEMHRRNRLIVQRMGNTTGLARRELLKRVEQGSLARFKGWMLRLPNI